MKILFLPRIKYILDGPGPEKLLILNVTYGYYILGEDGKKKYKPLRISSGLKMESKYLKKKEIDTSFPFAVQAKSILAQMEDGINRVLLQYIQENRQLPTPANFKRMVLAEVKITPPPPPKKDDTHRVIVEHDLHRNEKLTTSNSKKSGYEQMRRYRYTGLFKSAEGQFYQLEVTCNGFLQAFFLLTADAIRSGRHYQLHSIMDEDMKERMVGDIIKCGELLY